MQDDRTRKSAQRKIVERYRRTVGSVIGTAIRDSDKYKTQGEVARAVGVSEDTMTAIVSGLRKVELGEIVVIAKALDIDPQVLVRRMLTW